jgi:hypothetical protein
MLAPNYIEFNNCCSQKVNLLNKQKLFYRINILSLNFFFFMFVQDVKLELLHAYQHGNQVKQVYLIQIVRLH